MTEAYFRCVAGRMLVAALAMAWLAVALAEAFGDEQEQARAYAAVVMAMGDPSQDDGPAPTPGPSGEECENCYGTGRSGDGLTQCPVCNGTGKKATFAERLARLEERNAEADASAAAMVPRLQANLDKLKKLREVPENPTPESDAPTRQEYEALKQKIAEIKKLRSENMAMVREALRDRQPVEGSTPKWLGDLDEAQAMANTVGKPLVVFWSGKFCVPCQEFEDQILEWEEIRDHTLRGAILVKVLVDTDGNDKRASNWGVTKTPALSVSNGNQNVLYEFEPEHSAEFVNTWLSRSLDWARGAPLDEVNPITPIVNYGQPVYGSAGGYATSYGSAGGQAAYGPAQGSAGGYGAAYAQPAYATGSGSAGGYGAYAAPQPTYYARPVFATRAAYYQQPAYAQPAYSQPSYSGGWGNGGGSVVCGPGGCFVQ